MVDERREKAACIAHVSTPQHVSLYTDFRLDDSYTPIKIRIMAGTHHHDLVEVRTRCVRVVVGAEQQCLHVCMLLSCLILLLFSLQGVCSADWVETLCHGQV